MVRKMTDEEKAKEVLKLFENTLKAAQRDVWQQAIDLLYSELGTPWRVAEIFEKKRKSIF